jgi:hypothetical protein
LPPQQDVDFLLNPVLVVGGVGVGALLIDEAGQVGKLINEIKELQRPLKFSQLESNICDHTISELQHYDKIT